MKMYEYWNDQKWVKVIFHGIFQRSKIIPHHILSQLLKMKKDCMKLKFGELEGCRNEML